MKKNETKNNELNIIGAQTVIKGEIISQGDLRIDGVVEGNITTETKIVVGVNAQVTGDMSASDVIVSGKTEGNIKCKNILTMNATAIITGDIHTSKIVIENGAGFNGNCTMGSIPSKSLEEKRNVQKGK